MLAEPTSTHGVGVDIDSEGGDIVLRFGQLIEKCHHVQPRVFQEPKADR